MSFLKRCRRQGESVVVEAPAEGHQELKSRSFTFENPLSDAERFETEKYGYPIPIRPGTVLEIAEGEEHVYFRGADVKIPQLSNPIREGSRMTLRGSGIHISRVRLVDGRGNVYSLGNKQMLAPGMAWVLPEAALGERWGEKGWHIETVPPLDKIQ